MKKLLSNGQVLIVTTPNIQPSPYVHKQHDPWHAHGFPDDNFVEDLTAMGKEVFSYHMGLVDGTRYWYVWLLAADGDTALQLYDAWQRYKTPGLSGFWEGEAFNFFVRPLVSVKFTDDEYFDYLAAN